MKIDEFRNWDISKKIEYLSHNGMLVGNRKSNATKYELYQIDGFYVELGFNFAINKLIRLNIFDTTEDLDPYLSQIDLLHLLES